MYCPNCNQEINENAKFCKYCGSKLTPSEDGAEVPRRTEPPKDIRTEVTAPRCSKCGKPCPEGATLCEECVSRALSGAAAQKGASASEAQSPSTEQPTPPRRSGSRIPVGAVAAVLVLLLAAVGGALAWRKFNATPAQPDSSAAVVIHEAETAAEEAQPGAETPAAGENQPGAEALDSAGTGGAVASMPRELTVGPWDDTRTLQGLEWDTDSMERCYVSNGRAVYSYDRDGELLSKSEGVGKARLYSLDYHDGKVLSMMRSSDNGRFKLKIYDASTMKILASTNLTDMHRAYRADQQTYQPDLMPAIDAIVVAPRVGGGGDWKIYVSYNVYLDSSHPEALHRKQQIYEYDYQSALSDPEEIFAERTLELDVGQVDFGLQTLEYEQDTNRMWCAVSKGAGHKSLYCLDWDSLTLVKHGEEDGWECPHAGNGFCSVGENTYYVLIPTYQDNYSSATLVKVSGEELEDVG